MGVYLHWDFLCYALTCLFDFAGWVDCVLLTWVCWFDGWVVGLFECLLLLVLVVYLDCILLLIDFVLVLMFVIVLMGWFGVAFYFDSGYLVILIYFWFTIRLPMFDNFVYVCYCLIGGLDCLVLLLYCLRM